MFSLTLLHPYPHPHLHPDSDPEPDSDPHPNPNPKVNLNLDPNPSLNLNTTLNLALTLSPTLTMALTSTQPLKSAVILLPSSCRCPSEARLLRGLLRGNFGLQLRPRPLLPAARIDLYVLCDPSSQHRTIAIGSMP
jgi:hypothetical protein